MSMIYLVFLLGLGVFSGLSYIFSSGDTVEFRSLESVTETGGPVYNRIRFIPGWKQDIWLMQQSHHGVDLALADWDRLEIVVDKTVSPFRASFYQLANGPLVAESPVRAIPLKARCYACHADGPRAVRPAWGARVGWVSRMQVGLWNLRIGWYGRVLGKPGVEFVDGGVPFASRLGVLKRPLGLKSCVRCHSDHGPRHELKIEHAGSARFMVEHGFMPPFPYRISPGDRAALEAMLRPFGAGAGAGAGAEADLEVSNFREKPQFSKNHASTREWHSIKNLPTRPFFSIYAQTDLNCLPQLTIRE